MRLLVCASLLVVACSTGGGDAAIAVVGQLENRKLDEVSGLARSTRSPDLYWAINDDGPARIHALDTTGKNLGEVNINGASNTDWEDLASFTYNGIAYLAIADIGDNERKRDTLRIYIVREPAPNAAEAEIDWQIEFAYPDGSRDAESLAADATSEHFYVLSKRDVPSVLYRLPLIAAAGDKEIATRLGPVDGIPKPNDNQLRDARGSGYGWQPTGMDFAADGSGALILTYAAVYYFPRGDATPWHSALQGQASRLNLRKHKNAESIAFTADGQSALVTTEKIHAPLLQVDLNSAITSRP